MTRALLAAVAASLVFSSVVAAQPVRAAGRVEAGAGINWLGHATLGQSDATETTPTGGRSRIFTTSSELTATPGLEAFLSVRVWRRLAVEAFASYSKPSLETTVSGDIEASGSVTASETITQYVFGGGVTWELPQRFGPRQLRYFVSGGVGYLRQLHESGTLAVTGHLYQAGGGVKYPLTTRRRGWLGGLGVRADARVTARVKGAAFDDTAHYSPALSATLFAQF